MKWVDTCIKNQLIIYVLAASLCIAGIFCLFVIPVTPFQPITKGQIFVGFNYPGASAHAAQTQVTEKVVNALIGAEHIDYITAHSSYGGAGINLILDSNDNATLLQTELKIMQAISASHLPSSVPQPKINVDAGSSHLISIGLLSNTVSLFALNTFLHAVMIPALSKLPGVQISTFFQDAPTVKIKLIPEKIAKYKLNVVNLYSIINSSYTANPLGNLYLNKQSYALSLHQPIDSLQTFGELVVGYTAKTRTPIFLKDIAHIRFEPQSIIPSHYLDYKGHPGDGVDLVTYSLANPFTISRLTNQYTQKLQQHLPSGVHVMTGHDNAPILKAAMHEVVKTIFIASILVLLVVLMFLGHLKTTIIPLATIPICLLGSIMALNFLGYSVNLITLLALVLAVGLVVDDAIVVIENIARYLEQGMPKHEAVLHGTAKIALTIAGITLTLLAVYLPITFCSGTFITFLKAFAIPLSAAVLISGITALTLTPVMSVHLISDHKLGAYQKMFNRILDTLIKHYQKILKHVLNAPFFALIITVLMIVGSGYLALQLPRRFFPIDPSSFVLVNIMDDGQDTIATLKQKTQLFQKFRRRKEVAYYDTRIMRDQSTGQLSSRFEIKYKTQYLHQTFAATNEINHYIKEHHIAGATAKLQNFSNIGSDVDFDFYLYGANIASVNRAAQRLMDLMRNSGLFMTVTNNIHYPRKQIAFDINTAKAAKFGIYRNQIANTLSVLYGGATLDNHFNIAGLSAPIVVQLNQKSLKDPQSIQQLQIQSQLTQKFYPLSEFVTLKTVAKPNMISTVNGKPSVEFNAYFAKNTDMGQAINYTNMLIQKYTPMMQHLYRGNARSYLEGNTVTRIIMITGTLCIYLLLTILFGSLLDPLIILFTVPFSVIGGAISLYLVGGSINLYSTLGLITLVGLITKHGVLIVRFANQELAKGNAVIDAVLTATHHRFRPILMTTLVMCLGALPLVFSQGYMYVARRDLGVVIIGGLLIGTIFSLLLVPLIYSLVKKLPRGENLNRP